jgi:hypothetical protein
MAMKTNVRRIAWCLVLATLAQVPVFAGDAAFAKKPTATAAGNDTKIEFSVTAACDVEVTILDSKGGEVRHLAAGQLGAKEAAEPLSPNSLSQSLVWNGKDDRGKALPKAAYTVRVRLNMRPEGIRSVIKDPDVKDAEKNAAASLYEPGRLGPTRPGIDKSAFTKEQLEKISRFHKWTIEADKEDDRCYIGIPGVKMYRFQGRSNTLDVITVPAKVKGSIFGFTVGVNGDLVWNPYVRFDRDLKEIPPVEGMDTHPNAQRWNYGMLNYQRARPFHEYWSGVTGIEGLDGRAYLYTGETIPYMHLYIWDTWENKRELHDGFQKGITIAGRGGHAACSRADCAGNFYLAVAGGPSAVEKPKEKSPISEGTIIKFNPEARWETDVNYPYAAKPTDEAELKTAIQWDNNQKEWLSKYIRVYPRVMSLVNNGCCCGGGHFDVDEFGRLYVPDSGDGQVVILDNAGNEIFHVQDTADSDDGKGTKVNLGYPHRLACSRQALYLSDPVNNRVLRIKLKWQTEETCGVK